MLYLAVAQAVALILALAVVAALSHRISAQSRSHARREDALLDKLLHSVGKPWTPAPSDQAWREHLEEAQADRREYEATWTPSPEQLPV